MKLLFVTQVLDRGDAVLGFVHRWVAGLAKEAERVRVLALEVGDTSGLPANVDHRLVGRRGTVSRWLRYRGFLREAFIRDGFDAILTHMVPRYSSVAAAPARRAGAAHYLWYTHAGVDDRLRRAERVVDGIFTASVESLRLDTPKKIVTGHGIDLDHFTLAKRVRGEAARLLSVGRLTPSKDPLTILEAQARLVEEGRDVTLDWVGGALASGDDAFGNEVRGRTLDLGLAERVRWHGAVPYADMPERYASADVFVSASRTGSVDKVVLEAMATGLPIVTTNDSFPRVLASLGDRRDACLAPAGDAAALAERIGAWIDRTDDERASLGEELRSVVARDHEVDRLLARLVADMARSRSEGAR